MATAASSFLEICTEILQSLRGDQAVGVVAVIVQSVEWFSSKQPPALARPLGTADASANAPVPEKRKKCHSLSVLQTVGVIGKC